jgi:hypothetical protein
MNKRIRELAEQATENKWKLNRYMSDPVFDGCELDTEKFAELIVRECAKVSERTGALNEANFEGEMIADAIKEHFGVEE